MNSPSDNRASIAAQFPPEVVEALYESPNASDNHRCRDCFRIPPKRHHELCRVNKFESWWASRERAIAQTKSDLAKAHADLAALQSKLGDFEDGKTPDVMRGAREDMGW